MNNILNMGMNNILKIIGAFCFLFAQFGLQAQKVQTEKDLKHKTRLENKDKYQVAFAGVFLEYNIFTKQLDTLKFTDCNTTYSISSQKRGKQKTEKNVS